MRNVFLVLTLIFSFASYTSYGMVKCPFCAFINEDGALFCEQCKSDISSVAPATVTPAVPIPITVSPVQVIELNQLAADINICLAEMAFLSPLSSVAYCAHAMGMIAKPLSEAQRDEARALSLGRVIPGVTVNVTPACADTTGPTTDFATGACRYRAENITQGNYSLFAQVGTNGGTAISTSATVNLVLPAPIPMTRIDAWAIMAE